jgi:Skp family chaperone for outer membrane proteins
MATNIKAVDFQILTKHYKTYRLGVGKIEEKKKEFLNELEPYKKEINKLLKDSSSNGKRDEKTDMQIQTVSEKALDLEKGFKEELKKISESLNEKCYDELSTIIKGWSEDNDADIVFGKMEIVYCKKESDITDDILDIIKSKDLYLE